MLEKKTFDAFGDGALDAHLRAGGRRVVLVAGLETSYCVLFSAASASQRGFLTLVAEDCCADDPAFDPAATAGLLDRYQDLVFWRGPFRDLLAGAAAWEAKLVH